MALLLPGSRSNGEEAGRVSTGTLGELTSDEPPIFVSYVQQHNLLIVRTSDESAVEEIAKLIEEIDRPTPQVLLEMKIWKSRWTTTSGQSSTSITLEPTRHLVQRIRTRGSVRMRR